MLLSKYKNIAVTLVAFIATSFFVVSSLHAASSNSDANEMSQEAETLLQDFMSNAKTLSADFSQTVIDEEGNNDANSSSAGIFLLSRPGKFRWQVATENNELMLLADGKNLWNYDIELEQVTVKPIDETISGTPAMLLSGDADVLDAFNVNGSFVTGYDDEIVQWLELLPKDTHNDFSKLRLGFSNKEIRIMELSTNVGQVIRIEFTNVVRNLDLASSLFEFEVPENVDVIGEPK